MSIARVALATKDAISVRCGVVLVLLDGHRAAVICLSRGTRMATTVTLDDEAAEALEVLRRQAVSRGISLDRYLLDLAEVGNGKGGSARSPHDLTPAEFQQWLTEVSAGMPPLPPLPSDFSRADLYDDHD